MLKDKIEFTLTANNIQSAGSYDGHDVYWPALVRRVFQLIDHDSRLLVEDRHEVVEDLEVKSWN